MKKVTQVIGEKSEGLTFVQGQELWSVHGG